MTVVYHVTCCQQDMKPKVLFATTDYSFFTKPVTQALQKLGYQVKIFDYNKPNLFARLNGVAANLHLVSQSRTASMINHALLQLVNYWQPDYLLVIKGEIITAATIQEINNLGVITINWYSDWYDSWPWIITHVPAYSLFVNMCRATHRRLKQISPNSYYLPVASYIDDQRFKVHPKKYLITFVGQYTPRREKYFRAISDLGLTIWGYQGWQRSSLKHIAQGPVSVHATREIIKASKITVNLLNGSDRKEPDQINTRTVETTSVGSFLLIKDIPILRQYFYPQKEVVTFKTPQELRQKAIYYLAHDQEREAIARAGYLRAKRDHTFDVRLKELFQLTLEL